MQGAEAGETWMLALANLQKTKTESMKGRLDVLVVNAPYYASPFPLSKFLPVKPNCKRVSLSRCLLIKTKPKTPVLSCFYLSYGWYRTSIPYKSSPPDPIVHFCSLVILLKLFLSQVPIPIRKPYAADARWDASLSSSLSVANVVKCRS